MEAVTSKRKCDESVPEAATNQASVNKFIIASPKIVCTAPGSIGVNTQVPVDTNRSIILTRPVQSLQLLAIYPMNPTVTPHKGLGTPTTNTSTPETSTVRKFRYASLNSNNLKRPAIRPELQAELTVTNTVATQTIPSYLRDNVVAKQTTADVFAVCKWCGHLSKNFTTCDGCKRNLDPHFKTYTPATPLGPRVTSPAYTSILPQTPTLILTPQAGTSLLPTPTTVIKTGQFYSSQQVTLGTPMTVTNGASKIVLMGRQSIPIKRFPGKKKKVEPECLTISSDEEEEAPANKSGRLEAESNANTSKDGTALMDTSENDAASNRTTVIQASNDKVDGSASSKSAWCKTPDKEPSAKPPEASGSNEGIHIKCRSIRIGSYKIQSHDIQSLTVKVAENHINFVVASIDGLKAVNVSIQDRDIPKVLGHFGKVLPVLFIYTTPGFAATLREQLNMTSKDKPYFDPCSEEESMKRITFLPYSLDDPQKQFLSKIFPGVLLEEIKQAVANEVLIKSTPSLPGPQFVGLTKIKMETRSQQVAAAAAAKVAKEVVKLVTYPPPPQTGGIEINSEDLDCLNEGEFLNDVIIDFYLKYLMNEKLSAEDKKRTHIFSSFFFPRLISSNSDEEPTIKLTRRRHNRVKTWTRHVDIFEKDFIVVPINQSSHWFLAVICFPGMISEVEASPKSKEGKETEGDECEPANQQSPGDDSLAESPLGSTHEAMETEEQESPLPAAKSTEPPPSDESQSSQPEPTSGQSPPTAAEKGPCILIFDSLPGNRRWKIVQILREYMAMEYETKKKDARVFDRNTMKGINVNALPRQDNYSDCGIFLLQYVESFFETPLTKFSAPLPSLDQWFPESKISGKRQELKELILSLQKQQPANNANKTKSL